MVTLVAADLARTGSHAQVQLETAAISYYSHFLDYIAKRSRTRDSMADFVRFSNDRQETLDGCLSRSLFRILDPALLVVLGSAGAYVTMIRYDVR